MRSQDQQGEENQLQDTVNNVRLYVEDPKANEEEVLRDQSDVQNDLDTGKDSEWNRSRYDDDCLVDAKCHLLRGSQ